MIYTMHTCTCPLVHVVVFMCVQHLQSIKIRSADMSGIETKVRKGEFRFFFSTSKEGRYVFKVQSEADRENWIAKFLKVINVRKMLVWMNECL